MFAPPTFLSESFDFAALDREASGIVALDAEGRIVWLNAAWQRFASANDDAWIARYGPGCRYVDAIEPPFKAQLEAAFERVRRTSLPFEANEDRAAPMLFPSQHLRVLPMGSDGLLVELSEARTTPVRATHDPANDARYRSPEGFVLQCSGCRRVHCAGEGWHWVEPWVSAPPPSTTHGLCAACAGYFVEQTRRARRTTRDNRGPR